MEHEISVSVQSIGRFDADECMYFATHANIVGHLNSKEWSDELGTNGKSSPPLLFESDWSGGGTESDGGTVRLARNDFRRIALFASFILPDE